MLTCCQKSCLGSFSAKVPLSELKGGGAVLLSPETVLSWILSTAALGKKSSLGSNEALLQGGICVKVLSALVQ